MTGNNNGAMGSFVSLVSPLLSLKLLSDAEQMLSDTKMSP